MLGPPAGAGTQVADLDRGLTRLINRSYARRHWLVPVAQVGQVLTISMNDPTKTAVVDDLAATTGFVVNIITSSQESIKRAFKRLYEQPSAEDGARQRAGDRFRAAPTPTDRTAAAVEQQQPHPGGTAGRAGARRGSPRSSTAPCRCSPCCWRPCCCAMTA